MMESPLLCARSVGEPAAAEVPTWSPRLSTRRRLGSIVVLSALCFLSYHVDDANAAFASQRRTKSSPFGVFKTRSATTASTTTAVCSAATASAASELVREQEFSTSIDSSAVVAEQATESTQTKDETDVEDALSSVPTLEIKERMVSLLSNMTGKEDEYKMVERYVNVLEDRYQPIQTLDFFQTVCNSGTWQLLFSTNLAGTPNPMKFRLCKLTQNIKQRSKLNENKDIVGLMETTAKWDLAEDGDADFQSFGKFVVRTNYTMLSGSTRMQLQLQDHLLLPSKGSKIPDDVEGLVSLLHRSIPKELFDPLQHGVDVTYVDNDVKIIRYTGSQYEACRDIFLRVE